MVTWSSTDIRRDLPEYKTREGDDVYNAPYRATQVDLNAFVLEADPGALNKLVNAQLNSVLGSPGRKGGTTPALLGSQLDLEFTCAENWIVLIFAAFRSLGSTDRSDREQGFVSALEVSVWVPILKQQQVAGAAIAKPAWYLPVVYTAPTASVATGREVFGYPKIPAYLDVPHAGGPPDGIQLRHSLEEDLSSVAAGAKPKMKGAQGPFRVEKSPVVMPSGWDVALLEQPLMRSVVRRFFSNVPLIFRKQIGIHQGHDGSTLNAGYTALIESKVPITRLSNLVAIRPQASAGIVDVLNAEVAASLGIKSSNPLQGAAVRGCTLDIQQGSEIWVASKPAGYIKPMSAPGNDLMRGFQAGNAYDLLGPQAQTRKAKARSSTAAEELLDIRGAVGEVYFSQPRENAIAALLGRHFPKSLAETSPIPDPARSFVALCFVRAHAKTEDDIKLYELSVMVPVLQGGQASWYIPYMFRSPGAAVIHAREWFGHPCRQGFIDFKPGARQRKVTMTVPRSFGPHEVRWVKEDGVVVDGVKLDKRSKGAFDQAVQEFVGAQRIVGLLQARHAADTSRACFQAMVCSTRTLSAKKPTAISGKVSLESGVRLGRLLDLEGKQRLHGYRLHNLELTSTLPSLLETDSP